MALPKLNAGPKYEMTIPSTGQSVAYRPFLVKEEKHLMIAMESQDPKAMLHSLVEVLDACCDVEVKPHKFATFDIEYMFLQVRSKSVGESTKVGLECTSCEADNEVAVDLAAIQVEKQDVDKNIQLTDDIILEMKYPSYSDVLANTSGEMSPTETVFDVIQNSIAAVITNEERVNMKDVSKAERMGFVESLNSEQFGKVQHFIESMPALRKKVKFTCSSCGHENEQTVEGLASFLS